MAGTLIFYDSGYVPNFIRIQGDQDGCDVSVWVYGTNVAHMSYSTEPCEMCQKKEERKNTFVNIYINLFIYIFFF